MESNSSLNLNSISDTTAISKEDDDEEEDTDLPESWEEHHDDVDDHKEVSLFSD